MAQVETGGAKTGGPRKRLKKSVTKKKSAPPKVPDAKDPTRSKPKSTAPPKTPDAIDRERQPRTPPAPVKVRMYADPTRKEPQKVLKRVFREEEQDKAKRKEFKQTIRNIHVTPVASPDARDSTRTPAQIKHDVKFVAKTVKASRVKGLRKRHRGAGVRTIKGAAGTMYGPGGVMRDNTVSAKEAAKLRAQGVKVRNGGRVGASIGVKTVGPNLTTSTTKHKAPVLDVLEETLRPLHGVAAAAKVNVHAIKTKGIKPRPLFLQASPKKTAEAAAKGVQNKDKTTFTDVLSEAGWNPKSGKGKLAKGAVGLTLDVGLDPTTYLTAGTGSIASKAATKAATSAAKKALAKGLTAEQAAKFGQRAATQTLKKADHTKGITIKFGGAEVPGVRKVTAKASKPLRAAGRKVTPSKVREGSRAVAADLNPNIAPVGVAKETSRAADQATRTARSKINRGAHEAQQQGVGIRKQIGEANYSKVIDALEAARHGEKAGRAAIAALPPELRDAAVHIRAEFKHARKSERQAAIKVPERKGYVPHKLTDEAREASGHGTTGVGRRTIHPSHAHGRTEQRPLAELRVAEPGKYSEDLPTLYATRKAEGATAKARADLNRRIGDLGQTVKKGPITIDKGESVYHIKGSDIRRVTDKHDLQQLADTGLVKTKQGHGGRYVVLNDDLVKRAIEGSAPTLQGPGIVKGLDTTQAGFKTVALATPGFHLRNFIGDTQNAYLGQAGHRIPKNMVDAGRVLKAEGRRDKAHRTLAKPGSGKGTIKTGRYGRVTYEEAADQLARHGAMRSGYTAREIPELAGGKGIRIPRGVKQAALNREDLPRLTTAIEALKKGATWEEAAQKVADYHFDYAHLTKFEREWARRAAPFYTFTARNIPLQTKSLITKPGKYANYAKVRDNASDLVHPEEQDQQTRDTYKKLEQAGVKLPGGWEKYLSEYEQRNAGIPISWKGRKFTVSAGLPLADINNLPGVAGLGTLRDKAFSMVTPLVKDPLEIGYNYSFFFRDQVERDDSPLVNAPSFVGKFPADVKKKLGIVRGLDKRGGNEVWKWPGKVDYAAHVVPGLPNAALKLATPGADRQNRGTAGKTLQVAGIRAQPIDATSNAITLAYQRIDEIDKKQAALRQTNNPKNGLPISAKNPTADYTRLTLQRKLAMQVAYQGKLKRGDATLPAQGGPPKGRSSSGVRLGGQSGGTVKLGGGSSGRIKLGGG